MAMICLSFPSSPLLLDAAILLFVGHGTRSNPWKDYATMEGALVVIAARNERSKLLLLCLGEELSEECFGYARIRFVGYQKNPVTVTQFYQAADVYLHAAKAETFPNTILEALACGIPERVEDGVTGFLVRQVNEYLDWYKEIHRWNGNIKYRKTDEMKQP